MFYYVGLLSLSSPFLLVFVTRE